MMESLRTVMEKHQMSDGAVDVAEVRKLLDWYDELGGRLMDWESIVNAARALVGGVEVEVADKADGMGWIVVAVPSGRYVLVHMRTGEPG
jgi:hypothetical protein